MEEVVDVPFGILGAVPSKDQTSAPANPESEPSTSFACEASHMSSSVSLTAMSMPTVPVTTCMFQEQFEKEVNKMYLEKNSDNTKANFQVVTSDKCLRIINRLKGIKAKESRVFKLYVRKANYNMMAFPGETAEVLCRTVKITETVGDETVTTLANRRVAAIEDFFEILSQIHGYENNHGGMQKTWKAVQGKYAMIPRSAVRKYIELCPECISKRATLAEKNKASMVPGPVPMVIRSKPSTSPKRVQKRKLPHEEIINGFKFSNSPSLEDIRRMQKKFISERDWDQFHAPRNVLLAMVGEVGEVAELFQWRGEVKEGLPGWSEEDKTHLGQELSDVLLYLIDLAERCHVDLPKAVVAKMALNANKYPADRVKGSSKKYTEYS